LNNFDCPLWFKILTTVISLSFAQYAFHRSAHIIPILWRVHRVHHGDFHLDASSAFRFHPVEVIGAIVFTIPFVVIIGLPPAAVAAYELVEIVLSLLLHANIRIPEAIERAARFLFVTPVLHRFHHSAEQAQTDSNYGNVFSIWDRLLRTYHDAAPGSGKPEKFGLDDMSLAQARDFMAQLRLVSRPEVAARPRSIKSVTID
jgi:sterol desaturase/sphingolipid hydroxylase (fatty acid hydroxylase superfamily)